MAEIRCKACVEAKGETPATVAKGDTLGAVLSHFAGKGWTVIPTAADCLDPPPPVPGFMVHCPNGHGGELLEVKA